jgi:hypothetical protein
VAVREEDLEVEDASINGSPMREMPCTKELSDLGRVSFLTESPMHRRSYSGVRRKTRKSYQRKCPCKRVGGTQYGADAAVTHVLLRDPRAAA